MPEKPSAVYSCPSCGALSQIDPSAGDGSVCKECGYRFKRPVHVAPRNSSGLGPAAGRFVQRDVVSRRRQVEREKTVLMPDRPLPAEVDVIEESPDGKREDEVVSNDGHKKVIRRRKKRRKPVSARLYILGVIWIAGIAGVLFLYGQRMRQETIPEVAPVTTKEAALKEAAALKATALKEERAIMGAYIGEHFGACRRVLTDFWRAQNVPAAKAQFVYQGPRVTPLMHRYYRQHGYHQPLADVQPSGSNLIVGDDYRAIESIWTDKTGSRFEVVFVRDGGEWRIDWEAYVRYSSTRWDVFLSGADEAEGDFRVFMREVKLSSEDGGDYIGLKFSSPDYAAKIRQKVESPIVTVPVDSELGTKVRIVLDNLDRETEPGDAAAWVEDPTGMARVRVLLEWHSDQQQRKKILHLKDLKADSWLAEALVKPISPRNRDASGEDSGEDNGDANGEDSGGTDEKG